MENILQIPVTLSLAVTDKILLGSSIPFLKKIEPGQLMYEIDRHVSASQS